MKIAVVVPWIFRLGGNVTAVDLANELGKLGHEVDLVCHEINKDIVEEIREICTSCRFVFGKLIRTGKHSRWDYIYKQFIIDYSKNIISMIKNSCNEIDYDAILLISNEGTKLARNIKHMDLTRNPIMCYTMMELLEHNFNDIMRGKNPWISLLIFPLYYILHRRYQEHLGHFDLIFSNSEWTSILANFAYGIRTDGVIQSISNSFFEEPIGNNITEKPYVVVPTASFGHSELKIALKLRNEDLNLVFYGPLPIKKANYIGFLKSSKMREVVKNANALLFLFHYEALGLIPIESLSLGTPVITYEKQGPAISMKNNEFVDFVSTYEEIVNSTNRSLISSLSDSERVKCRESVLQFRLREKAIEIERRLEAKIEAKNNKIIAL